MSYLQRKREVKSSRSNLCSVQETALKGEAQLEETVSALTSLCKLANLDRIEAANAK